MLGNNRFVPLHAVQNIEEKLLCLSSCKELWKSTFAPI